MQLNMQYTGGINRNDMYSNLKNKIPNTSLLPNWFKKAINNPSIIRSPGFYSAQNKSEFQDVFLNKLIRSNRIALIASMHVNDVAELFTDLYKASSADWRKKNKALKFMRICLNFIPQARERKILDLIPNKISKEIKYTCKEFLHDRSRGDFYNRMLQIYGPLRKNYILNKGTLKVAQRSKGFLKVTTPQTKESNIPDLGKDYVVFVFRERISPENARVHKYRREVPADFLYGLNFKDPEDWGKILFTSGKKPGEPGQTFWRRDEDGAIVLNCDDARNNEIRRALYGGDIAEILTKPRNYKFSTACAIYIVPIAERIMDGISDPKIHGFLYQKIYRDKNGRRTMQKIVKNNMTDVPQEIRPGMKLILKMLTVRRNRGRLNIYTTRRKIKEVLKGIEGDRNYSKLEKFKLLVRALLHIYQVSLGVKIKEPIIEGRERSFDNDIRYIEIKGESYAHKNARVQYYNPPQYAYGSYKTLYRDFVQVASKSMFNWDIQVNVPVYDKTGRVIKIEKMSRSDALTLLYAKYSKFLEFIEEQIKDERKVYENNPVYQRLLAKYYVMKEVLDQLVLIRDTVLDIKDAVATNDRTKRDSALNRYKQLVKKFQESYLSKEKDLNFGAITYRSRVKGLFDFRKIKQVIAFEVSGGISTDKKTKGWESLGYIVKRLCPAYLDVAIPTVEVELNGKKKGREGLVEINKKLTEIRNNIKAATTETEKSKYLTQYRKWILKKIEIGKKARVFMARGFVNVYLGKKSIKIIKRPAVKKLFKKAAYKIWLQVVNQMAENPELEADLGEAHELLILASEGIANGSVNLSDLKNIINCNARLKNTVNEYLSSKGKSGNLKYLTNPTNLLNFVREIYVEKKSKTWSKFKKKNWYS